MSFLHAHHSHVSFFFFFISFLNISFFGSCSSIHFASWFLRLLLRDVGDGESESFAFKQICAAREAPRERERERELKFTQLLLSFLQP
jgi:hypothetical protein